MPQLVTDGSLLQDCPTVSVELQSSMQSGARVSNFARSRAQSGRKACGKECGKEWAGSRGDRIRN